MTTTKLLYIVAVAFLAAGIGLKHSLADGLIVFSLALLPLVVALGLEGEGARG